ncbi:peptidase S51 [Lactococcus lactis subsp. lactis]|jgi:dipeptidase E|uniref:Type 1 glutamine amidotransferase-like domain-containing protein n=1 Tax=Lactobacillales TaxID=186826 RepID=UPI002074931C|nr:MULTISPECIES: Type 1 glutamine amidotransferase-like domain-containing protein [Lactobacillales]MCM6932514.1 Type 1 glutamine amidotransferase-like domain-containing protein [Enterococcus italicus]MCT0028556.1 peptidase S51 [Lactococcus lactis subsp. lactis]MCT0453200.1 peptidase S51 [Lactococcus cremoris]MCT0509357.1 peptidase S51 [Lactococcus cremoris]MCT3083288.1 peptidase S51 [Leuconostoc citreum]
MNNILITSYLAGNKKNISSFLNKNKIEQGSTVLFIPTAGNVEEYTGYIDEGKDILSNLGYQLDILDVAKEDKEVCYKKIKEAHAIIISGGNTFYLLQELKGKNLLPILKNKISESCPYIGESAGGIILTSDIVYNNIMDDPRVAEKLDNTKALSVINFFPLPHYIEEPFTESVQGTFKFYKDKLTLVPINNYQSIIVDDGQYHVVNEPN